jgi:hypothetical protein
MFRDEGQDSLKKLAQSKDYDGKMARDELNRRSEIERQAQLARLALEQAAKQMALASIKPIVLILIHHCQPTRDQTQLKRTQH